MHPKIEIYIAKWYLLRKMIYLKIENFHVD